MEKVADRFNQVFMNKFNQVAVNSSPLSLTPVLRYQRIGIKFSSSFTIILKKKNSVPTASVKAGLTSLSLAQNICPRIADDVKYLASGPPCRGYLCVPSYVHTQTSLHYDHPRWTRNSLGGYYR